MMLAHVGEQLMNEPADKGAGRVNARNQLGNHLHPIQIIITGNTVYKQYIENLAWGFHSLA
jgi:hypothetical protein